MGERLQIIRPPFQGRGDYATLLPDGEAHDRFLRRLEPANYTIAYFNELVSLLEVEYARTGNDRSAYELAFTLLQNCADERALSQAISLLSEISSETIFRPGDVARLRELADQVGVRTLSHGQSRVVERVNWSLNNECPMVCVGCYNPFTPAQMSFDEALSVLDKLADHGTGFLVFSGGDPLLWDGALDLVDAAAERGFSVALDTTGYTIDRRTLERLSGTIDSLRLPLDGSTNEIERAFRRSSDRALVDRFLANLRLCDELGFSNVRIHTVVSQRNLTDLANIADLVFEHECVSDWMIFQWWGRRSSAKITERMLVDHHEIDRALTPVRARHPGRTISYNSAAQRELVNVFIQANGQVVTFAAGHSEEFILGDILRQDMSDIARSPILQGASLIRGWDKAG